MHRTNPAPNRTGFLDVAWVYCQVPVLMLQCLTDVTCWQLPGQVKWVLKMLCRPNKHKCVAGIPLTLPFRVRIKNLHPTVHYLCLVGRRKKPLLAPTCCRDAGEMQVKGWSHCRGGCFVLVLEVRGLLPSTRCKLLWGQRSSCPPPLAKELAGRYTLVVCSPALNTLWFRYTVQVQCTCTVYRYGAHCAVYSV